MNVASIPESHTEHFHIPSAGGVDCTLVVTTIAELVITLFEEVTPMLGEVTPLEEEVTPGVGVRI